MHLSNNNLYKILVETASDAVSLHGLDGTFVFCSPYSLEITGYAPSELIGRTPYEFIHPEDIEKVEKQHTAIQNSSHPSLVDYRFKTKSGAYIWLQASFRSIEMPESGERFIVCTTRDFGERKQLENEIENSKAEFKAIFDSIPDAVVYTDSERRIVSINPGFQKLFGYKLEDVAGKTTRLIYADSRSYSEQGQKRYNPDASNSRPIYENQYITKDKRIFTGETTGTKVVDSEGALLGFLGIIRDITRRKTLEDELLKSQQLLQQMARISKVGGWMFEIDTEIQQWTEETYKIHEVDSDFEPNVEKGLDFFVGESKAKITEAVQRAIEHGEPYDLELEIETAKGNLRYIHTKGEADLENRRIFGAIQDVTEKKKFQESQMRSSQLSALGEVAAGVAHEINNPINGVINYAQILINKNDENDKSNQILERIIREGSRISNIVQNLLNFAQRDRGEFSSLDLMDIVVEPLNLTSQLFKKDGIHIELGIPDDLPKIYGNQLQLEQVVLNLLSNARYALNKKFPGTSSQKFIVIDAISSRNHNGGTVQLRIKDYGCGIPKELLDRIFNPFYTTKEAGVGTGLGMSVSHDILEKHGASIAVYSEVEKFTNVTIDFPVKP